MKNSTYLFLLLFLFFYSGVFIAKAQFSGNGSGTNLDPYQITSPTQLNEVRNNLSAHYKLMNDIDLSGWLETNSPSVGWQPISIFSGSFDGNFKVVTGLWISRSTTDNIGLFGQASGIITNLGISLSGSGISGKTRVGGLVGGIAGDLTITKCFVLGNVTGGGSRTGGLIGGNGTQRNDIVLIQNCYFVGNVAAPADPVGGILGGGYNATAGSYTIENCYVAGKVISLLSTGSAGAIIGNWTFTTGATDPVLNISDCFSLLSTLKGKTGAVGRIHGWVKSTDQVHLTNNNAYENMQIYVGAAGTDGGLTSVTGTAINQNGANKSLEELSSQNIYTSASWNFTDAWLIGNESYQFPVLRGFSLSHQPSTPVNFEANQFEIPSIISNNMILQRNTMVRLWGKAVPNTNITVVTSWNQMQTSVTATNNGNWEVMVATGDAGGPYSIEFSSEGETKSIQNILLGEVWLCAGQSNMTMPLKGWGDDMPIEGSAEAIAESATYSDIRMFTASRATSLEKQENNGGSWLLASSVASEFSATGYFYALELRKKLGVPVGMIHLSWPGSTVQAWTSRDVLQLYPEVNLNISGELTQRTPTALYNGMFNPVSKYTVKGVIWYQGEDNVGHADLYRKLFPAFVRDWRKSLGEVPIYYTQLPPYKYQGATLNLAAQMREVQFQCLDSLNNVQMITTGDLGNEDNIHPAKKKEIGQRLAYWSLWKTYDCNEIPFINILTPICSKKNISGNKIILSFNNIENGLVLEGNPSASFEIAGSNNIYYPANAQVIGGKLEVWSDNVANPQQVRYGYHNYYQNTLFNNYMLPVSPFRTETLSETTSSISETRNNNSSISFNYTMDVLSIKDCDPSEEKLVYDSMGRLMFRGYENEVNVSNYSSGVYFLRLKKESYKFIKL